MKGWGTMAKGLVVQTTKQKFVDVTYHMIQERGLENLKIRDIAKRVGCTAAALYKHFDTMDYLTMLASIRFLDDYMADLIGITESPCNSIELDIAAWKAFNRYAFLNPPVFLHLFWGPQSHFFEDAVTEYFQLFPAQPGEQRIAYFYTAVFTGSIQERDFIWLRRAASEGLLKYDDAVYISRVNNYTVFGMLTEHKEDYTKPEIAECAAKECDELIEKTIYTFVCKGKA